MKLSTVLGAAIILGATLVPRGAGQVPAVGSGRIDVLVTNFGAPVAHAAVCVGTSQDLNRFFQGQTDAQGRVSVSPIPTEPYVITANTNIQTAQVARAPPAAGPSFIPVTMALRLGASPRCPTKTAAGPQRSVLGDVTPPPVDNRPLLSMSDPFSHREYCFGAVGMACGQAPPGIPVSAACAAGRCTINGGSWEHDTCCHAHPSGHACAGGAADATGFGPGSGSSTCRAEWDKAVRLTTKGLNWIRLVDFSRANSSGTVEHSLYCAPAGTLVPTSDASKCCARTVRAPTAAEQAAAVATGETLRACR